MKIIKNSQRVVNTLCPYNINYKGYPTEYPVEQLLYKILHKIWRNFRD
jgi:hypothetical protein